MRERKLDPDDDFEKWLIPYAGLRWFGIDAHIYVKFGLWPELKSTPILSSIWAD